MFNYCIKIISQATNLRLIKAYGLYYLILIVGFSFLAEITISVPFLYIIAIIVGTIASFIYRVIFISNIRLDNYENPPVIEKNKRKLLLKSWLLFRNELVAAFFASLGLICFIWPGIVLLKRYQYVIFITEDLELGPIEALRLSRKFSEEKGWQAFNATWISGLLAALPVIVFFIFNQFIYNLLSIIYLQWMTQTLYVLILMPNYKIYKENFDFDQKKIINKSA